MYLTVTMDAKKEVNYLSCRGKEKENGKLPGGITIAREDKRQKITQLKETVHQTIGLFKGAKD